VPAYAPEPETVGGRRQGILAAFFLLLALTASYLPAGAKQGIAWAVRSTLLRPFVATQEHLVAARLRARDVDVLQARLDSVSTVVATQSALADENRTLRALMGLSARVGPAFHPATVLRPGTPGSESMFLVDIGSDQGVAVGAPVMDPYGLVGVIREVRATSAVGMDWTHPDFRASAMLADGTGFGIVENHRGAFRELDRPVLTGTPYHESVPDGTPVLTSGLGGVFPRGIPIGRIDGVAETQAGWRKSYWLRPMVQPASVTHVLVEVGRALPDVSGAWPVDSIRTREESIRMEAALADSVAALTDSVRRLRARVDELRRGGGGEPPGAGR
jgi:cell shape-determining protein MreC